MRTGRVQTAIMEPAKTEQNETFRPDNGADDQLGPGSGRHAAGEDPAKRQQILEGARRVFMSQGFDAASMNDITREAGVSKGTLYVYFENKEDLFKALIIQGKTLVIQTAKHALNDHEDVEEALYDFGVTLTSSITSEATIRSMRMVIGVIDRIRDERQQAATIIPLGRAGTPEEAAGAIFYLCSPWSNFVQGQVLTVNGGQMTGMTS